MGKKTKEEKQKNTKNIWSVNAVKKCNTKIRGKNENVGNTYKTININIIVPQNSGFDFKTRCITDGIQSISSHLKCKDDL